MIPQEFRSFLTESGVPGEALEQQISVVEDFIHFLTVGNSGVIPAGVGKKEVEHFGRSLIVKGQNREEYFTALARYGYWLGNRPLYVAWLELMDCNNAMQVLDEKIAEVHGQNLRDQVFREPIPALGADEQERCAHTLKIIERMDQQMTGEERQAAWFKVQHGISPKVWQEGDLTEKEKFRQSSGIDDYLANKKIERDKMLTKLHEENKLWYTVEITDEVLEFVKSDPEIEAGRREGNKIFITKIPYNAARYLHETDPVKKRYLACHCPLVREAILQGKTLSEDICACSLGHASHYLAGLDQEVKGEVLESAVKGDPRCRFVFTLQKTSN